MQNISKWQLHSAGSALREDGDIYMDFLGTHPTRHDPRVLQAELFQPRLNTEESKKNPQFQLSECASHQGLEQLHRQNLLLALGGGNKIQFEPVLGWFCSKIIHRKQTFCYSNREILEHPRRNRALPTCGSGQPEKQSAGNTFS